MATDPRRKSGLGVMSGMFGLLGRRGSDVEEASEGPERSAAQDPFERVDRPARDVARLLAESPIFQGLNDRELMMIAEFGHIARCHGGTTCWSAGDPAQYLVQVREGRLEMRVSILPGNDHTVRVAKAGDLLGVEAVFGAPSYHLAAVATERTAVVRLPIAELRRVYEAGRPAAIKLYVAFAGVIGTQVKDATLEVGRLLEKTSIKPTQGSGVGSSELAMKDLLAGKV